MHWTHQLYYSWEVYTLGTAPLQQLEASLKLLLCDALQQLDLVVGLSCIIFLCISLNFKTIISVLMCCCSHFHSISCT